MLPEVQPADTGLAWGIRRTFVSYVRAAGGAVAVVPPAGLTATGEFYFPFDTAKAQSEESQPRLQFSGQIGFLAHGGFLRVELSNPRVTLGAECTLTAETSTGTRVNIVAVILPEPTGDGTVTMWLDAGTRLHADAVELFGGSYEAGEEFAPLTIRIPTAAATLLSR